MAAATRSPGRLGRKADERGIGNKTKRRRRWGKSPGGFPRLDHRAGDPHIFVSALQYSLRINEGDAFGWRLSVRVEIFLRLQPLLATFVAAAILRTVTG